MNVLVVGGSGSGKSAYAERIACSLSATRTYIATMRRDGTEAQTRITRHRKQREGLGFLTFECPLSLPKETHRAGVALIEDLGNLAANALFAADGTLHDQTLVAQQIQAEVVSCLEAFEHGVVVSNEVGCEGVSRFGGTRSWVRLVGTLNCRLASMCDAVVEVVAGQPSVLKGVLPWTP